MARGNLLGSVALVAIFERPDLLFGVHSIDAVDILNRMRQRGSIARDRTQPLIIELQPSRFYRAAKLRPVAFSHYPIHIYIVTRPWKGGQPTLIRVNLLKSGSSADRLL